MFEPNCNLAHRQPQLMYQQSMEEFISRKTNITFVCNDLHKEFVFFSRLQFSLMRTRIGKEKKKYTNVTPVIFMFNYLLITNGLNHVHEWRSMKHVDNEHQLNFDFSAQFKFLFFFFSTIEPLLPIQFELIR